MAHILFGLYFGYVGNEFTHLLHKPIVIDNHISSMSHIQASCWVDGGDSIYIKIR